MDLNSLHEALGKVVYVEFEDICTVEVVGSIIPDRVQGSAIGLLTDWTDKWITLQHLEIEGKRMLTFIPVGCILALAVKA
jgi:hypothetical protein